MLLSVWLLALLILATLASLTAWAAFGLRRWMRRRTGKPVRRGWSIALTRVGALLISTSLALTTVADGVNRHFAYIPTFGALMGNISPDIQRGATSAILAASAPRPHGVVLALSIGGPISGVPPRPSYIYLPPAYFDHARARERFPVFYLLHGSPGISLDWIRGGFADRTMDSLLQRHRVRPFLIVFPDFNLGYARDTECQDIVGGAQIQTYLVRDVVDYIDSHFRTIADRRGRAIGGLSTGGYCGINLTFRHPDVFSAAVSHSGYYKPVHSRYTGNLFGDNVALERANTPADYLPWIRIVQPTGVYLDAGNGTDLQSLNESLAMAAVLKRRGVAVDMRISVGGAHTYGSWRHALLFSLPWLSGWFDRTLGRERPASDSSRIFAVSRHDSVF